MANPLRIAYLIFAHKNPDQLGRLLRKLYYPGCMFYIHVDAKSALKPFALATTQVPSASITWLAKRTAISWGRFSLPSAYLSGFQEILQKRPEPDFIVTLSGQDYPITTNQVLHDWLSSHIDQTIMDYDVVTEDSPHLTERVNQYFLSIKPHRTIVYPYPDSPDFKKKLFNTTLRLSGLFSLPRQFPMGHQMYFGTNWFQVKPTTARYLIEFARSNPSYIKFARTTFVPDEFFFQTILLNAPDSIRNTIYNYRMTFMQWDRPEGSYTKPISTHELPTLLTSGKFFARKFDGNQDHEVLDRIDQCLTSITPLKRLHD